MDNTIYLLFKEVRSELPKGQDCFGSVNELEEQFGGGGETPLKPSGTSDQGIAGEND